MLVILGRLVIQLLSRWLLSLLYFVLLNLSVPIRKRIGIVLKQFRER
jgi:hypothetical protein